MMLLLMSRLHLVPGTIYATLESTYYAEKYFETSHVLDNMANAYKHALWNMLIAYYAQPLLIKVDFSLQWAKRITDMHEVCFQNEKDATAMDLANNLIGRNLYKILYEQRQKRPSKKEILDRLYEEKEKLQILQ